MAGEDISESLIGDSQAHQLLFVVGQIVGFVAVLSSIFKVLLEDATCQRFGRISGTVD